MTTVFSYRNCLTLNNWKVNSAIVNYYKNPDSFKIKPKGKPNRKRPKKLTTEQKVSKLFNGYRDPSNITKINSLGVFNFLEDLGLSPDSILVLIIAWKFQAEVQCEFSEDEFRNGMKTMNCESLKELKEKLPFVMTELDDSRIFKDLYQFTFNYAKEKEKRSLDVDTAIAYWNIVMIGRFKYLDLWCTFLTVK